MEDFRVDVVVGKGPGATAIPLQLPHFTLVGATTRAGLLPSPLRDRFGFTAHLDFYDAAEIEHVITRSAQLLDLVIDKKAIAEIAGRSRGTPRIANRLLRRVRDFAQQRRERPRVRGADRARSLRLRDQGAARTAGGRRRRGARPAPSACRAQAAHSVLRAPHHPPFAPRERIDPAGARHCSATALLALSLHQPTDARRARRRRRRHSVALDISAPVAVRVRFNATR